MIEWRSSARRVACIVARLDDARRLRAVPMLVAAAVALSACSLFPDRQAAQSPGQTEASLPTPAATAPATTMAGVERETAAAPAAANVAGRAPAFSTKQATYILSSFDALPGWGHDDFTAGWTAFLSSCRSLAPRTPAWSGLCRQAAKIDGKDALAIRRFYEREFSAYQIRDDDRRAHGVVTGYFEPEIAGSRRYAPPYIYPVYATPDDLLMLDTRTVPKGLSGTVAARVEGRTVTIQQELSTRDRKAQDLYALDLADVDRSAPNRRMRLRIDGRQLVPYFTRQEIEARGAPNAAVLAFVRDANALYELQIQGSGRIRMTDGSVLRLAYAEQNGHPFQPMVTRSKSGRTRGVRVRGRFVELELDDEESDAGDAGVDGVLTRGFSLVRPAHVGPVAVPGQKPKSGVALGTGNTDPSYVFFRGAPQGSSAVVGALGVPLTAGRSIAVDPRSTPLGYPVFVDTREPVSGRPIRRLTLAQDTGGAIRGAVRADYFFGSGADAASAARRMKQRGQLWILLPRGMAVAAAPAGIGPRTRGGGVGLADCLVPDDDSCAEDAVAVQP